MKVIDHPTSLEKIRKMAKDRFGDLVKAVVDVEKGIMAVDAELHSDEEALLLEQGSSQENLWGINLYPAIRGDDWIEFDSMINVRPSRGNPSRSVEDLEIRKKIIEIVNTLVKK